MVARPTKSNDDRLTFFYNSNHTSRESKPGWHRMIDAFSIIIYFFEIPYIESTFVRQKYIIEGQILRSAQSVICRIFGLKFKSKSISFCSNLASIWPIALASEVKDTPSRMYRSAYRIWWHILHFTLGDFEMF